MYVMERLFVLKEGRSGTSEAQIAGALLQSDVHTVHCAKQFGEKNGISKATLYRFCAKGGFSSFQALMEVLEEEKRYIPSWFRSSADRFVMPDVNGMVMALLSARQIVFNGDFSQIHLLTDTIKVLSLLGKQVEICSDWDLNLAYRKLELLDESDVYIHLDANIRLDLLHEYVVNRPYLISYGRILQSKGRKFYLSRQTSGMHPEFVQIRLEIENRRFVRPYLIELDEILARNLMKEAER